HALRRATEALELLDGDADDRPAVGDQHHLVALTHHARARELALRLRELNRLHAHPAAALARVLADPRALAVAVLGHDEQVRVVVRDGDRDHLVVGPHAHALDA